MTGKSTSTQTYMPGERVTVTLAGVRITDVVEQRTIIVDLGHDYYVAVPIRDGVLVERVEHDHDECRGAIADAAADAKRDRCQVEPFAGPHEYNPVREVADDYEVCGEPADHPIHQVRPILTGPASEYCDDACADERQAAGTCRHTDGDDL